MTKLTLTSTSYSVANETNGIKAEGTATVLTTGMIQTLYLTFYSNADLVGNVSYNEYDGNSNYNYSIKDNSKKEVITQMTDTVIADIKAQV